MKGCRPLSEEEVRVISQSFGGAYATRDKALFLLGVKFGFRISELLSLTVGDVYQHGRLVDCVSVQRRHMKDRTEGRSVVLKAEARSALQCWLEERAPHGSRSPPSHSSRAAKEIDAAILAS